MSKILLIEDDRELTDVLRLSLEDERYSVDIAFNGNDGLEKLRFYKYDLVILDWEMPEKSGFEVLREFRRSGGVTPVLMLTGRDSIDDKEVGLDTGCDDYLTKPFNAKELSARIRALLRRPTSFTGTEISVGDITLQTDSRRVFRNGIELQLLPLEYRLLEFLMRHYDQPFSPEALLDRVWESSSDASIDVVRTYVKTLRKKIAEPGGTSVIRTVHGVGYKVCL